MPIIYLFNIHSQTQPCRTSLSCAEFYFLVSTHYFLFIIAFFYRIGHYHQESRTQIYEKSFQTFQQMSNRGSEIFSKGLKAQHTAPGGLVGMQHMAEGLQYFPGLCPVNRLRSTSSNLQVDIQSWHIGFNIIISPVFKMYLPHICCIYQRILPTISPHGQKKMPNVQSGRVQKK